MLHPFPGQPPEVDHGWQVDRLLCNNLPVTNWISELSCQLIQEHEDAKKITFRCTLYPHAGWTYEGRAINVAALELFFACSKKWVGQTVRVDVTLGLYNHLRGSVVVPSNQGYCLGWIDRDAWTEMDAGWEEKDLEPNSFELYLTLLNPIPSVKGASTPKIDELIAEKEVCVG